MPEYEIYRIGNREIFITGTPCKSKEISLLKKMIRSIGFSDELIKVEKIENAEFIIAFGNNYFQYEKQIPIKLINHPSFILKDYTNRILEYWEHWLTVRKSIEECRLV